MKHLVHDALLVTLGAWLMYSIIEIGIYKYLENNLTEIPDYINKAFPNGI